ncbi:serine/threonine-protein kinase [Nocardiopsis sp. JB363]|uniref:serine/threonine-protein kinase n=1 Tax=Nocardiopsis sp. JB363 TaxID=1434837 RepID=UPI00097B48E3|nr:serine/threonine-protein kinase [Nocardiopsis sp. JB363]SIO87940.1 Serine/threonine protein kinase PrkC, regulator of stationary phase [Nocardiopsis sp. JB363]
MPEERVLGGRYRLLSKLGAGGMGQVWQAVDELLDRPVAVKLIQPGRADSDEVAARFRREARLTARLAGHPNVVILHDFGHDAGGVVFTVMELVPGRPLSEVIKGNGPLPIDLSASLVSQAAAGLSAAHAAGIVHRDVKPGNLMVIEAGPDGPGLKVVDFGIAAVVAATQSDRITRTGQVIGTPLYMPPEQVRGERVDRAGDLYSLGAILYQMLTGEPPFHSHRPLTVLRMHLDQEPLPPSALRPEIPPALSELVSQMLAKRPEQRPAGAEEVRDRLAPHLPRRPAPIPVTEPVATLPYTREAQPESSGGAYPIRLTELVDAARDRVDEGDFDTAAEELRTLIPLLRAVYGADHPDTLRARRREAYATGKGGDHSEAVAGFETLLPDLIRVYGTRHPETLAARYYLATNAGRAGDHALAAHTLEALLPDLVAVGGPDSTKVLTTRLYLGFEVGEAGETSRAVDLLGGLVPDLARLRGTDAPVTLRARHYRAAYLGYDGRLEEAVREYEALLADHVRLHGEEAESTRGIRTHLTLWRAHTP